MALGTELVINPVTLGFGGMSPLPNVQPFTLRSASSYNEILEGMRSWIITSLIPYLNDTSAEEAFAVASAELETAVNTALATQATNVNTAVAAALQEVVTAQIPVAGPVVLGVLQAAGSATLAYLDSRYAAIQTPNALHRSDGTWHVDDFGAKGDGTTDDRASIQAAIEAAHSAWVTSGIVQSVYLAPKLYRVGVVNYYQADGTTLYGVTSLLLKSGVYLCGTGTLKIKSSPFGAGALYSVIRADANGISYCGLRDITIDGDRSNQTASNQCGNITLDHAVTDVSVENVKSYEANGNSIMIAGTTATAVSNVSVKNCVVYGANTIGIQVSQFSVLQIIGNRVRATNDNAIDIYGEDGTTTAHGNDFQINNNTLDNYGHSAVGIFIETVANGTVNDNRISNYGVGIHVNRINGAPDNVLIANNQIRNITSGMQFTGDTNGVTIRDNVISYYNTACFELGGAGNVSNYYFFGNVCKGNSGTTPTLLIRTGTNQASFIYFQGNFTKSSVDYVNGATTSTQITAGTQYHLGD